MAAAVMISETYPHLREMVERQLAAFPEHAEYMQTRFAHDDAENLGFADNVAANVLQIAGPAITQVCENYRWFCGAMLDEELHFRRTGRYRLSTFEEADAEVYSNREFMSRCMDGLLASQLWWRNHTEMLRFFRDEFVVRNPKGFRHLEIGPGHGLFLYLAAASQNCAGAEGWDVSDSSIANTRKALQAMQVQREVVLRKMNLFDAPKEQFNSITCSEVIEHLERPQDALKILRGLLTEDGRIFLNAPINSPAPDHIYLFETPEHLVDMIEDAGFAVESSRFAPCTGSTLERARKQKRSISVGVIARRA
jgi:2-polyprenyl-3-methyl-5-hydroxy-6-metoxy-1,4-benzoquinol methylase